MELITYIVALDAFHLLKEPLTEKGSANLVELFHLPFPNTPRAYECALTTVCLMLQSI
ncbi:hypothetical protein PHSC3_001748 [Chlamydiales bacterium STE3]|nr:hypothetical protein PHSC3_001748 [Chlamydiales bacterium STE3]